MLKPSLLALATVAALALSTHADAALSPSAGTTGTTQFAKPNGPSSVTAVLYDQTDSPADNGAPDQNFEASLDDYDSEGADDFEVTDSAGWTITGVNTVGTTGDSSSATVNVTFYSNSGANLPDTAECTYSSIVPDSVAGGSLAITLPTPCELGPGMHWVAIQVNQDYDTAGQHFWSNRSVQSNAESVWRNPADGFASGCTTWGRQQSECAVGGAAGPDFLFQILGDVSTAGPGPGPVAQAVPATGSRGLLTMFALFLAAGFLALRFSQR